MTAQTPLNPGDPNVVASAYTNNFPMASRHPRSMRSTAAPTGSISSTLAATGTLAQVGGTLGVDATSQAAFDIGQNAVAYLTNGATPTTLFTVDLGTGAASPLGVIGAGLTGHRAGDRDPNPRELAVRAGRAGHVAATGSSPTPPARSSAPIAISGLVGGDTIVGIDFRPANGHLYGLGSRGRLYDINPTTGAASQVGAGPISLSGTRFGVDFNPAVDRLRVVSDTDENLRINPDTGVAIVDTPLAYDAADPNSAQTPTWSPVAYTGQPGEQRRRPWPSCSASTAPWTSSCATPTPTAGVLSTVGPLGVDASAVAGFDISPRRAAFALLNVGGIIGLYQINTATGAATPSGRSEPADPSPTSRSARPTRWPPSRCRTRSARRSAPRSRSPPPTSPATTPGPSR